MAANARFADAEIGIVDDVVDLGRYPIHEGRSAACRRLVADVRDQLADDGCLSLPAFLRAEALGVARAEIAGLAPKAIVRCYRSSVYGRHDAERILPADDPRRISFERRVGHLTRDQIPPDAVISRLYAAPACKDFIAACTGSDRVFEYADPLAGLIATIVPPAGVLPWHYDTNEFVVSIMTQDAEHGGLFQYCPNLRRPGDENLAGLGRVLRGEADDLVRTRTLQPGDLQIFAGRYSLHQVSRVEGSRARHVAVLSYANRPGVIGPVDRTRAVYGRITEAHLVAEEFGAAAPDGLIL